MIRALPLGHLIVCYIKSWEEEEEWTIVSPSGQREREDGKDVYSGAQFELKTLQSKKRTERR